jgi:hypothetical protein
MRKDAHLSPLLLLRGRIPMAQAATANTDELLSQLASSEIDRLLAEADGNPAPRNEKPSQDSQVPNGSERAALLEAAGFESSTPAPAPPAIESPAEAAPPVEDERAALLHAAGFESPIDMGLGATANPDEVADVQESDHLPIYLKPLVWINAPLDSCPSVIRPMLGKVGVVTLLNALAVLTYVIFFRKH